jgi:large subunit ribosomal protein L6
MSRIGRVPVSIPQGVQCQVRDGKIFAKGPKGELGCLIFREFRVDIEAEKIHIAPKIEENPLAIRTSQLWGTLTRLIANMLTGVSKGFEQKMELVGVGYKAELRGKELKLALGYSHDVLYPIPEGISIVIEKPTLFTIMGPDKQRVGQTTAELQAFRKPEPYKGKGVLKVGQFILRKEGKSR